MSIDYDLSASGEIRHRELPRLRTIDQRNDVESFEHWLMLRRNFMEDRGWHFGDDFDRYDEDPQTMHIIKETEEGEIMVGMRLTPCDNVESSLSWSMLSPQLREKAASRMPPERQTNVWDLTRLVPGEVPPSEVIDSLLEVFGNGAARTSKGEVPPRWFFTTTPSFMGLFKRQGAEFIEIARGKNDPEDSTDVVFCYADPLTIIESLKENNYSSYRSILRGMEA